jgi:hypothetical protein
LIGWQLLDAPREPEKEEPARSQHAGRHTHQDNDRRAHTHGGWSFIDLEAHRACVDESFGAGDQPYRRSPASQETTHF